MRRVKFRKFVLVCLVNTAVFELCGLVAYLFGGGFGLPQVCAAVVMGVASTALVTFFMERKHTRVPSPSRLADLPPPPQNLRLKWVDGTIVPVDAVYLGVKGGVHHWAIPRSMRAPRGVKTSPELLYDSLPGNTAICLQAEMEA